MLSANKEDTNHLDYIKHLMELILEYGLRLKTDKDIPFQSILGNILNEDYRAFYDYKKRYNYLDIEKTVMVSKTQVNSDDNTDDFTLGGLQGLSDRLQNSSARL